MKFVNKPDLNSIFDLDFIVLKDLLVNQYHQPPYRAEQVWKGLYQHFYQSWEEFPNVPHDLLEKIIPNRTPYTITPNQILHSKDKQTTKVLLAYPDHSAVEAVLMRYSRRNTICISTQVGCPIGCAFCATGQMGFSRNLTSGEIVQQVLFFARHLLFENEKITNIVLMGMGEPFLNYENSLSAIRRLSDKNGFGIGQRHFTISTVGIPPMMTKFADELTQINLAISLHAASDDLRSKLVPINDKYPIDSIISASKYYINKTNRRISFEWVLIKGINDTDEQIDRLCKLLKGLLCHVNLIQLNPSPQFNAVHSERKTAISIQNKLAQHGIPSTIRLRRGIEIQAGCGQLASQIRLE